MITVIVPHFKKQEQLVKCLEALGEDGQAMVIDDSATGKGFTASVNEGLRAVLPFVDTDKYALILNQDCYVKPGAIKTMIGFMDAHPKCAIAGIKQLSSHNEDMIIHGGTAECYPAGRHKGGSVKANDCNESKKVPWVNGACMIVRLEAVLDIGLMDSNFKMFCSDSDWSYTARARGWETWYIADAVCVHEQGASKTMDDKMSKIFYSDSLYFRDKWLAGEVYRDLSLETF